ncbi:Crp/Fnr family transcriptional regulator [Barnesiella viscericola]|uniref:Crp/Fnr family transcriptional regulator n=1 Tax=Barnesiella viscericola TaxID=397865 RepID=A0A921MQV1_9BACT|nr:Crp/Fnr family transcriptional regulator [Barnesiella viscericola]HJG88630.1 Crp/Fnr family transcriptional regulator [Barnesiella viscericola]
MNNEIYEMPLFRGGNKDTIERIMHDFPSRYVHYKKGDTIAMQGNACRSLYILCEGSVYAKMISEEGKEFTLDTLSAPDVLASAFVFSSEGIFPVTILANSDCDLWIVSKESLLRIIESEPLVLRNYLTVISDHSMFLSKRLNEFALQTLSSRIMSYIEQNGSIQNLQEAAFILGVARPSLSRVIQQLVGQGVLKKENRGYILS